MSQSQFHVSLLSESASNGRLVAAVERATANAFVRH
jgi:hypothetical protein